jgi:DNA-binding SARP family transcriptional activator
MSTLRIQFFGGIRITRGGAALPPFATQRARDLFAYLALHRGRLYPREVLIETLWGQEETSVGRKSLRTALWRVRAAIDRDVLDAESALRTTGDAVAFNSTAGHWVDVDEFEALLARADGTPGTIPDEEEIKLLRAAVALYQGDALDGMYDDWCLYERERLRLKYFSALERLLCGEESRRNFAAGIPMAHRLLSLDPLHEHVHRTLMRCYAAQGNRGAALRQYRECVKVLREELDVSPMEDTVSLYREILELGSSSAPPPRDAPSGRSGQLERLLVHVDQALVDLQGLTLNLEESRAHLNGLVGASAKVAALSTILPPPGTLL